MQLNLCLPRMVSSQTLTPRETQGRGPHLGNKEEGTHQGCGH